MNEPVDCSVLRILDAALNRASEGLRVVEDYLRMVREDANLARLAKQLRHDLTTASSGLGGGSRHAARDTPGDVGTRLTTTTESSRTDAWQVALASFQRTAQALRSLEEYGKLVDAALAGECEALRYRLYTLEKAASTLATSIERLADVRLLVLIDGGTSSADFAAQVKSLVDAGTDALELRDKRLADRELLDRARILVQHCRDRGVVSIVNDRPDIAAAAGADGVHLGQDDLPVAMARKTVGPRRLIGVSTHHIEQARQAVIDGANYLGAGPTFPSTTKHFDTFPGLDYLRQVTAEISLPTFAIGGIHRDNVADVLATGISRVAVAGAVTTAAAPGDELKRLQTLLSPANAPDENSSAAYC